MEGQIGQGITVKRLFPMGKQWGGLAKHLQSYKGIYFFCSREVVFPEPGLFVGLPLPLFWFAPAPPFCTESPFPLPPVLLDPEVVLFAIFISI